MSASASPQSIRRRAAAVLATTALAAGALVASAAPASALTPTVINLLTINDFHGRINSATVDFAKTVEKLRQDSLIANGGVDNTLVIGAGDLIGASEFASAVQQDQPTIDVMNALGLDVSSVGNHEFDQGFGDLADRVIAGGTNATWDYLGANVYDTATGEPALPEYGVYEVNGISIGVVGVVTQETPTLVSPDGVAMLTFGDPVEAINRVADELTDGDPGNGEADVVIATMHEGAPVGTPGGGTLESQLAASPVFNALVTQTSPKVAALIQAHTHQVYAWDAPVPGVPGATRPILQTGNYAANVGQLQLTVDADTGSVLGYTAANVARQSGVVFDPQLGEPASIATISTIVANALAYAAEVGNTVVSAVTADVTTAFSGGTYGPTGYGGAAAVRDDRASESTLGNLVADSLVDSLAPPERGGAEIGIVNPGGLRAELLYAPDGAVTYAEANGVLPFLNNLTTTTLTGAQLRATLEEQWQTDATGAVPSRPYLQLGLSANAAYTYDPDPDGDGVLIGDLDDQGRHITSITVDGVTVAPTDTFRVGTFSFLTQGGDNFRTLGTGTDVRDSGLIDRDAWIAYLTDNAPISPSYAKHAVGVTGVPASATAGGAVTLQVSKLDLTSLGAPANTSITATLDGTALGTFPVSGGAATVALTLPAGVTGARQLVLTASPSGSVVHVPITIAPAVVKAKAVVLAASLTSPVKAKVTRAKLGVLVLAAGGTTASGAVTVTHAGKVVGTGTVSNGRGTVTLDAFATKGIKVLRIAYAGSATVAASTGYTVVVVR